MENVNYKIAFRADMNFLHRLVSLMTSRYAQERRSRTAYTIPLSFSRTLLTRSMGLLFASGRVQTKSAQRPSEIFASGQNQITTQALTRRIGSRTV